MPIWVVRLLLGFGLPGSVNTSSVSLHFVCSQGVCLCRLYSPSRMARQRHASPYAASHFLHWRVHSSRRGPATAAPLLERFRDRRSAPNFVRTSDWDWTGVLRPWNLSLRGYPSPPRALPAIATALSHRLATMPLSSRTGLTVVASRGVTIAHLHSLVVTQVALWAKS
jgi:hypothetical protein